MANSTGDDDDEGNEDELDGLGGLFNDDLNFSSTCNLQPALEPKVSSPIIDLRGTHCNSSGDDINGGSQDSLDGLGGLFDVDANFSSTCHLQPSLPPGDSHCCSSAINGILKCCTSLSSIDIGCWKSLKKNCFDMKVIYKRYYLIIRMAITSLIVCSVDMVSDVWTSIAHFNRCDWMWGTTSAILVILPMSWIAYTLIKNEMWNHTDFREKKMKIFLVVCAILQVLVIYWFIWKARKWWSLIKQKKVNNENLNKKNLEKDIHLFKKIKAKEGLLEGGLQLSLQSYILLKKIKNFMRVEGCPDNCYNTGITYASSANSFSMETCIDWIQIVSIFVSLFALAYSQAFMYQRHKMWRKLARFLVYIQIISVRMFIPAVLAVFDNKCKWYLAPATSLFCYSILYYSRRFLTEKGCNLPKFLEITEHKGRQRTVLSRRPSDVLYWGLNHMLFNVTSVSGLAISIPYMICTLPYVVIQDELMSSMYFYYAAAVLTIMCVIVNVVFVVCFRDYGIKKIIPLSCDS